MNNQSDNVFEQVRKQITDNLHAIEKKHKELDAIKRRRTHHKILLIGISVQDTDPISYDKVIELSPLSVLKTTGPVATTHISDYDTVEVPAYSHHTDSLQRIAAVKLPKDSNSTTPPPPADDKRTLHIFSTEIPLTERIKQAVLCHLFQKDDLPKRIDFSSNQFCLLQLLISDPAYLPGFFVNPENPASTMIPYGVDASLNDDTIACIGG